MSNLNNTDDIVECPLCMEPLEVDDLNFYPCTCGYQICRFCWHRIRTDENQLCPACRKEYPENPADFKPLSQEEMVAFKFQKRQRDQKRKQEITENRKHLANVRVVQKNLVFVVGLPPRLADAEILKKHEYFGKYGKIHKVVINPSTTYAGVQGPSASAYVTYVHNPDALRAIQSVNNIMIDGRLIKTSLGTTKYCSHFMKNQQCPKSDCMYLHELGDPEASFTKEEMHQGKHQDYEKRLHDVLIATSGTSTAGGLVTTTVGSSIISSGGTISSTTSTKVTESHKTSGIVTSNSAKAIASCVSEVVGGHATSAAVSMATAAVNGQTTEAWPCLSVSPVGKKESLSSANTAKSKKDRQKQEKSKPEKNSKAKNKNSASNVNGNAAPAGKDATESQNGNGSQSAKNSTDSGQEKNRTDKDRDKKTSSQRKEDSAALTIELEANNKVGNSKGKSNAEVNSKSNNNREQQRVQNNKSTEEPNVAHSNSSISSSSSSSSSSTSGSSASASNGSNGSSISSETRMSRQTPTPNQFHKINTLDDPVQGTQPDEATTKMPTEKSDTCPFTESIERSAALADNFSVFGHKNRTPSMRDLLQSSTYNGMPLSLEDSSEKGVSGKIGENPLLTPTSDMSKLSLFDDNSFFSLNAGKMPPTQTPSAMMAGTNKLLDDPLLGGRTMPNLPDLINGIDGYQSNINCTNDWEDAFKSVILKTNKQMEEKLQQQQQLQQHIHNHHQLKQQEDLRKLQELQKRNILLNTMRVSQLNNGGAGDMGRHSHFMPPQNPLLQHQGVESALQNPPLPFETNMSKFFDFHKHQQQQKLQHYGGGPSGLGVGGLGDNFHMMSLLENKPLNSQLVDHNSLLSSHLQQQQQQQQKQKLYNKLDPMMHHQQMQHQQQQQPANKHNVNVHATQNHLKNQYLQNSNADDDLGFDPFIETQKALAELIENEEEQLQHNHVPTSHSNPIAPPKQQINNQQTQPPLHQDPMLEYMQRLRLPPPGFNHLNSNLGGYGSMDPRLHTNQNSKMLPFMNLPGNNGGGNPSHMPPQQQQQQQHPLQMPNPNVWSTHLGNMQQQQPQQSMGLRHDNCNQPQNMGNQKSGYSGSDWTAMDPAILSFRQFSFPQQNQMGPQQMPPQQQQQPQATPQDIFLQHLSQQSGFGGLGGGPPSQLGGGNGGNMPNQGILNSQSQHHSSQGHLNVDANVQGMLEFLKTHQFV
ncbi:CCR4-NOT transcription complex subunit 4 [Haematobia irritans]|uniref:CCR4-NOT transcription complex subunit 4 n=1 Tax=Haematobia irritans TaxID=7368 RepID=UPI003F4F55D0